jgi:hypothetical protein
MARAHCTSRTRTCPRDGTSCLRAQPLGHRLESEMTQVTDSGAIADLLHRFYGFHDALIRRVEFSFSSQVGTERARVVVSARDSRADGDWVNVEFYLDGLSEYRIARERSDIKVMTSGLRCAVFDGVCFVDFSPWSEETETMDDFRRSDFFAAASVCSWSIDSYTED